MSKSSDIRDEINSVLAKKYKSKAPVLIRGSDIPQVDFISTGLLANDWVNGGGGPRGHIEQVYGRRSSGKTSSLLYRIGVAQRSGLTCAFIDLEHTLDKKWATKLGVNMEELILHEPEVDEYGEITMEVTIAMLKSGGIDLLVMDSITSLTSKAQVQGSMEDKHYGGNSGLITQFFDKIIGPGIMYFSDTNLILVNQPREVIGSRIPLERLPGGRALSHYSSIINQFKQDDKITIQNNMGEEEIVGSELKIINTKNKVGIPFREHTIRLQFKQGFNPLSDVLLFAKRYNMIEYRGAWAYYNEENLGQGINAHMQWLIQNQDKYFELKKIIGQKIKEGK